MFSKLFNEKKKKKNPERKQKAYLITKNKTSYEKRLF